MNQPEIGGKVPCVVSVENGKCYWWCTCGRSKSQPCCDGSHKVTGSKSLKYSADEMRIVYLCACKRTRNAPFCDGSHKAMQGGAE